MKDQIRLKKALEREWQSRKCFCPLNRCYWTVKWIPWKRWGNDKAVLTVRRGKAMGKVRPHVVHWKTPKWK
jgi:hypothetical protein